MQHALAFLAGGLVGVLGALALREGEEPVRVVPEMTESLVTHPDEQDESASEPATVPAATQDDAPEEVRAFRDALEKAAALAPRPERRVGEGVISGQVLDQDGTPLAGVEIRIGPESAPRLVVPDGATGLYERWIRGHLWREANQRTTWTDADGQYRFEELVDRQWWVRARLEGWRFEVVNGHTWQRAIGDVIAFSARRVHRLEVRVVDAGGASLEKAVIQARRPNDESRQSMRLGWSARKPHVELMEGPWVLSLETRRQTLESHASNEVLVRMESDVSPPPVTLVARAVFGIDVQLRRPEGLLGPSNVDVQWLRLDEDEGVDLGRLYSEGESTYVGREENRAVISGLDPGRYLVGLAWRGRALDHEVVVVEGEPVSVTLTWPDIDRSSAIELRVQGPDGSPLPDLSFGLRVKSRLGEGSSGATVMRADGVRVWVDCTRLGYLLADGARIEVTTDHPSFGAGIASGTWPLSAALDLTWSPTGVLTVLVEGGRNLIARGLGDLEIVAASDADPIEASCSLARLTTEGIAELEGIAEGPVEILLCGHVGTARYGWGWLNLKLRDVQVTGDRQEVAVQLPAFGDLTLEMGADEGRWPRELRIARATRDGVKLEGKFLVKRVAEEGRIVFDALPVGAYVLSDTSGAATQRFVLGAATTVTWAPEIPNALRLHDPHGRFSADGLQDGDHIVALEGRPLGGPAGILGAVGPALAGKGSITLEVKRGRGRHTVKLARERFRLLGEIPGYHLLPDRR